MTAALHRPTLARENGSVKRSVFLLSPLAGRGGERAGEGQMQVKMPLTLPRLRRGPLPLPVSRGEGTMRRLAFAAAGE
jgi:hypothetical protein